MIRLPHAAQPVDVDRQGLFDQDRLAGVDCLFHQGRQGLLVEADQNDRTHVVARRDILQHSHLAGLVGAVIIDAAPASLEEAIAEAELIVVGVPTLTVGRIFAAIRAHGRPDVLITDVASVKGSVVMAARDAFGAVPPRLIPAHPIAGAEKSGVEASSFFTRSLRAQRRSVYSQMSRMLRESRVETFSVTITMRFSAT